MNRQDSVYEGTPSFRGLQISREADQVEASAWREYRVRPWRRNCRSRRFALPSSMVGMLNGRLGLRFKCF